jgi:rod shape-determining protein MreD
MTTLIAIPILGLLLIFQSAVASNIMLLHGTADLILLAVVAWALQKPVQTAWQWGIIGGLMVSIASALPLGVSLIGYPLAAGLALILRQRVWQVPILAMFIATFAGTLAIHAISFFSLNALGNPYPLAEVLNQITLPSILLNLLLAIPAFALLGELANLLYPEELEV